MKKEIKSDNTPQAIGPYSQAIAFKDLIFTSGQIALDPETQQMKNADIEEETRQVFANLQAVLEAGGSSFEKILKVNVYLKDLTDFQKVNGIYQEYLSEVYPARATFQVAMLPKDARIEIDMIGYV